MAELSTKARNKLPKRKFALPNERKYPIENKAHAANAKARAKQQYEKGALGKSTYDRIVAAANRVLKGK